MLTIVVENLFCQVSYNLIGKLVVLLFSHETNKLRKRLSKIVLCIEEVNDLRSILTKHVLHLTSELKHALLHEIEKLVL